MATTLAVDCGGGGIKASALDASGAMLTEPIRLPTPYPFSPDLFVKTIADIGRKLPNTDRATVGLPGMIRHGVVITTPHYITRSGPRSRVLPELREQWTNFDARSALEAQLTMPTIVVNDAEMHGAGVITGVGTELVLTLGTGLGYALFDNGRVTPHLELSQAPVRWGLTYDEYIGETERRRLGNGMWSRRVARVVEGLRPVFLWDRLFLGGGNAQHLTPPVMERLGDGIILVPNAAALVGGARLWTWEQR